MNKELNNKAFESMILSEPDKACTYINKMLEKYGTKFPKEEAGFVMSPKIKALFESQGYVFKAKFKGSPCKFQKISEGIIREEIKEQTFTNEEIKKIKELLNLENQGNKKENASVFYGVAYDDLERSCNMISKSLLEQIRELQKKTKGVQKNVILNKIIEIGLKNLDI